MADEKESPFIEEGEKKVETETPKVDVDALVQTLEQFGVDTPEKLDGKLQNADQYAQIMSERDQYANALNQAQAELANLKTQTPAQVDEYGEGQPIDIESLVAKGVKKVLVEERNNQMRHQHAMNEKWVQITSHPRYELVKDEFETALKDPATVMKLQSGQVDAMQFFNDMVINKYASVTKQTVEAFKQLKDGGIKPPHVESDARAPMTEEQISAGQKKLDKLVDKAKSNKPLHDDEQDFVIDATLGDLFK